ncbi:MAG: hypothetical protein AABX66_01375 [Nanoarchaeota archaeon]
MARKLKPIRRRISLIDFRREYLAPLVFSIAVLGIAGMTREYIIPNSSFTAGNSKLVDKVLPIKMEEDKLVAKDYTNCVLYRYNMLSLH